MVLSIFMPESFITARIIFMLLAYHTRPIKESCNLIKQLQIPRFKRLTDKNFQKILKFYYIYIIPQDYNMGNIFLSSNFLLTTLRQAANNRVKELIR